LQGGRAAAATSSNKGLADPTSQIGTVPERQAQPRSQWLVTSRLVFSDVVLACLIWFVASILHGAWGRAELSEIAIVGNVSNVLVWVGLRALLGLYPGYGLDQTEELRRQTYAVGATLATISTFALVFHIGDLLSRLLLVLGFLSLLLLAPLARHFVKRGMMRAGVWGKPVVILGAGEAGARLMRALQRDWHLGYRPVAVFDSFLAPAGGVLEGVPYRGPTIEAKHWARRQHIDTAILTMPRARRKSFAKLISRAVANFRYVIVIPTDLTGITTSAVVARDLSGTLGVELKHNLLNPWAQRAKRTLDLLGVVVAGLLICPLLLTIAVLIKLDSPGPVFYFQQRLGSGGKHFRCWKFRTMHADADSLLTNLLESNAEVRSEWEKSQKLRRDPRVTRTGRFLRKTSLDELPQLWNVLRGEMSLVGPRPIVDAEVAKYHEVYKLYRRVRPGISGLWQVSGRSNTTYEERVAMDAYYVRNWSVWLDLVILARTVKSVISSLGAY